MTKSELIRQMDQMEAKKLSAKADKRRLTYPFLIVLIDRRGGHAGGRRREFRQVARKRRFNLR